MSGCGLDNRQRQPIIDVHLHAYPGLPPDADPMWEAVRNELRLDPPNDVEEHRARTLAQLDEHNVVLGVLSGPSLDVLESWKSVAGDSRFLLGAWLSVREEIQPSARVALGDPLRLEPVLIRFPRLRVYLQHAGHPFLERTKAILAVYPQVYVDTGVLAWVYPRREFYSYLQALVDAGFSDRIMFGSDQVFWPEAIGVAIEAIEEAPFLTESQKRDILYNNAVRFLELPDSVVQRHAREQ